MSKVVVNSVFTDMNIKKKYIISSLAVGFSLVASMAFSDTDSAAAVTEQSKPGLFSVDQESAERALERSLIQVDALLLDKGTYEYGIDFTVGADTTQRTSLETVVQQSFLTRQEIKTKFYGADLSLRFGLPFESQVELRFPFSIVEINFQEVASDLGLVGFNSQTNKGWSDAELSFVKALLKEKGMRPDLTVSFTYDDDNLLGSSGEDSLGSGNKEYEVSFQATKRQAPLVFSMGFFQSYSDTVERFRPGNVTGFSFSAFLAASPYTSLRFTFSNQYIKASEIEGVDIPGTKRNLGDFSVGLSSVIARGVLATAALSMGLNDDANDYRFSFGLSRQAKLPF